MRTVNMTPADREVKEPHCPPDSFTKEQCRDAVAKVCGDDHFDVLVRPPLIECNDTIVMEPEDWRSNTWGGRTMPTAKEIGHAMGGATKLDDDKVRLELIPPELLTGVGTILTFGAKKYAPRNWELGMAWSRVFGALMRHMWSWWRGQDLDPETGKSHLWHAGCCIAFLIAYEERGVGEDDRYKGAE